MRAAALPARHCPHTRCVFEIENDLPCALVGEGINLCLEQAQAAAEGQAAFNATTSMSPSIFRTSVSSMAIPYLSEGLESQL